MNEVWKKPPISLEAYQAMVGKEIGVSSWHLVDQPRIDTYADVIEDHQFIHVDPERAKKETAFGTTIAHGFLTLSLLPVFFESAFEIADARMGVNYGLNRVRFTAPVPVGSRLRAHFQLLSYEPIQGGAQLVAQASIEREGVDKPVCVAESITRRYL